MLPPRRLLAAALLAGATGLAPGAQTPAPRPEDGRSSRADYEIQARLHEDEKQLAGSLALTWTNESGEEVGDLWFHLYWNGFANDRSTHLWESRGRLRGQDLEEGGWGWQRVDSVRIEGQELLPTLAWRTTPGGRDEDRTVFSVDLPRPVAPGETIEVRIDWEAQIPRLLRRTGYEGDFLFIAHWFPKLGVYEAGRGWNCHQFHARSEFYSNYGTYDVTLDLPIAYEGRVGASGVQVRPPAIQGDRVLARFLAPSPADRARLDRTSGRFPLVHGFAWTASPRYEVRSSTFHFERWSDRFPEEVELVRRALGPEASVKLRDVTVTVMIQPEREAQWQRHFEATCAALFFYGLWFGEYPYEHLTVVDPPWGGREAGGMEYPTLFTCGTRLFTRPDMHQPEGVTIHEAGHQFWYGLVGNNEFEAAWLDEGLNSYADSEVTRRVYGARRATTDFARYPVDGVPPTPLPGGTVLADVLCARRVPLPWTELALEPLRSSGLVDSWRDRPHLTFASQWTDPRWEDRSGFLEDPASDPIDRTTWEYLDRTSWRVNSYRRPAVALRSLEGLIGSEAFLRGMRHFAETWRYRHPYPDDFFAAFVEGSGVDVGWYFDDVFRGTGTVDWSVEVEQFQRPAPRGLFPDAEGRFVPLPGDAARESEAPAEEPSSDAPEAEAVVEAAALAHGTDDSEAPVGEPAGPGDEGDDPDRPFEVRVVVRRDGELCLPLDVELGWADGSSERLTWTREAQAASRWLVIERESPVKLTSAVLDPEGTWHLELDRSDDRWYAETDEVAPLRWTERVFNRLAHLLHWQAGIGG